MSQLIDYWNNNIDNYTRGQLSAVMAYLVYREQEYHRPVGDCSSRIVVTSNYNIYKLEIGNMIYDGSLF